MLRLVAGMIAAFMVGGLVAMPFTGASIAAQDETSDEETVCCEATAQYDTLAFATRTDCQRRNGIVVENFRCEPDKEMVCCDQSVAYGPTEFTTREICKNNGKVVENNRCEPKDDSAVAERSDAAGFEGARDIGDVPILSPDGPIYNAVSCGENKCECDTIGKDDLGCDGIYAVCRNKGASSVDCHTILLEDGGSIQTCECSF